MRVLVTGGSGFIGTNLVEHFAARGDDVQNFDSEKPRNVAHEHFWRKGDLLDATGLHACIRDFTPEIILHMAARTDLDGRTIDDYSSNTVGVENLIAVVEGASSLQRIIFASSRLVCRIGYLPNDEMDYCPSMPYGESKVIGEKLVRAAAPRLPCPWLIVRPTSIWGPWFDEPYKAFFLSIYRGRYVHPGLRTILKSFGFVGNTVHQIQRLIKEPAESVDKRTIYLGDYPPIDVTQMAEAIQREIKAAPIRTVAVPVLRLAALIGDGLKVIGYKNPPLTSFRLDNILTQMIHDLEPLRMVVGELPYSMEAGIRLTVDWLKSNREIT